MGSLKLKIPSKPPSALLFPPTSLMARPDHWSDRNLDGKPTSAAALRPRHRRSLHRHQLEHGHRRKESLASAVEVDLDALFR